MHDSDLQQWESHAHAVHVTSIIISRFKHCTSRYCDNHCEISILLQKRHRTCNFI